MTRAGVYPMIWDSPDSIDQYLLPYYEDLRRFYLDAAEAGQAAFHALV